MTDDVVLEVREAVKSSGFVTASAAAGRAWRQAASAAAMRRRLWSAAL